MAGSATLFLSFLLVLQHTQATTIKERFRRSVDEVSGTDVSLHNDQSTDLGSLHEDPEELREGRFIHFLRREKFEARQRNDITCAAPFLEIGSQCLYVVEHRPGMSWAAANQECSRFSSRLAVLPKTRPVSAYIRDRLRKGLWRFWIGAVQGNNTLSFRWIDDDREVIHGWAPGEPSNGGHRLFNHQDEDCVELVAFNGYINDEVCSMRRAFICEAAPIPVDANPCDSSQCGTNSRCQPSGQSFSCSCLPGFTGLPPNCEQHLDIRTCIGKNCRVPAPPPPAAPEAPPAPPAAPAETLAPLIPGPPKKGPINSTPDTPQVPPGSDPYYCYPPNCHSAMSASSSDEVSVTALPKGDPCDDNPCGLNAICESYADAFNCTCAPGYFGYPPKCHAECASHEDCPETLACSDKRCHNPCAGYCGFNAMCQVIKHIPVCTCPQLLTGDPHTSCNSEDNEIARDIALHFRTEGIFDNELEIKTTTSFDFSTVIADDLDPEYTTEISDITTYLLFEEPEYTTTIADITTNLPLEGNLTEVATASVEE